jgi:hypothetical protein
MRRRCIERRDPAYHGEVWLLLSSYMGNGPGLYSKPTPPASRSGDVHPQPVPGVGGPSENRRGIQSHRDVDPTVLVNLIATGRNGDLLKEKHVRIFIKNKGGSPRYMGLEG